MKAVIFDMDGVLADSHGIFNRLFTRIVNEELDLGINEEDFSRYSGLRFEERIRLLSEEKKKSVSKDDLLEAINKGRLEYFTNAIEYVEAYPGVHELLKSLKKEGIKIGLGTNGSKNAVLKLTEHLGIADYFESIVTYNDVTHPKPAPDMFIKNAENLGVDPKYCIVIEDSLAGITAAKQAGMKVVGIATTKSREDLIGNADLVLDGLSELTIEKLRRITMIKGIIFDMDGVVIDSNHLHYDNWNSYFEKNFGVTIPKEEFAYHLGESTKDFSNYFLKAYDVKIDFDEFRKVMVDRYFKRALTMELKDGFKETLAKLSEDYKIALATGADLEHANHTLDKFGIRKYFQFITAGDLVKKAKPEPEIFLMAAGGLGLKPEDCIVVEDAYLGLQAAKRAGMKCVMVYDDLTASQDHSMSDIKLPTIRKLTKELIDSL